MSVNEVVDREERPAWVQFEVRSIEDVPASQEAGRYVGKDIDFVLVTPPYSKDCFEHKADQWFENVKRNVKNGRTPPKWLELWQESYQRFRDGQELPINGTPIRGWSLLSPSQEKMLLSVGVRSVEDLAGVNEEGLRRIGMGGIALKQKAESWLKTASDHGPVASENAELHRKVTELEGSLEAALEQNRLLAQQVQNVSQNNLDMVRPGTEITVDDITEPEKTLLETLQAEYKSTFGKDPHPASRERGLMKKLNYPADKIKELMG